MGSLLAPRVMERCTRFMPGPPALTVHSERTAKALDSQLRYTPGLLLGSSLELLLMRRKKDWER